MTTRPVIVGNHAFFFREGDALTVAGTGPGDVAVNTPATAGRNVKPASSTDGETAWIDFGVINNVSESHERESREVYTPSPGQLRLHDVLETKRKLGCKFECEELSPLSFELAFGTEALTAASTVYNPLAGPVKKGWLKIQQYDDKDQLVNTIDRFVHIKTDGEVKFDDDVVKTPIAALTLHSVLNAGTLTAA